MVDEMGEGIGGQKGVGDHDFSAVDVVHLGREPVQIHAVVEADIGVGRLHIACFVVETEEDRALLLCKDRRQRQVDVETATFVHHVVREAVAAKHGHQTHLMAQQTKVVGDVASHAAVVEIDSGRRASERAAFGLRHNGNVDVGFAYDGDFHAIFG